LRSGTEVIPFPLFEVLDGKNTEDYLQRVEPSPSGGQKMGEALFAAVVGSDGGPIAAAGSMRPAQMER
jgi:hypothetical protein